MEAPGQARVLSHLLVMARLPFGEGSHSHEGQKHPVVTTAQQSEGAQKQAHFSTCQSP